MSNESMPHLIKIGATTKAVRDRAAELSRATGIPTPFCPEVAILTDGVWQLEKKIHKTLAYNRNQENREFFLYSVDEIIKIFIELVEKDIRARHLVRFGIKKSESNDIEWGEIIYAEDRTIHSKAVIEGARSAYSYIQNRLAKRLVFEEGAGI